jgi:hypothetical protein
VTRATTLLFAAAAFGASALLFALEPLFGKLVLPWVGATPAAWTTCVMFFQAALLVGYAIAHLARVPPLVHAALMLAPVATLPIALVVGDGPPAGGDPTLWLLGALALSVGAPFVALASAAPALQRWFPRDPYPLYAASNAGSLLALLGYPLVVEPSLPLSRQGRWFAIGYAIELALVVACALVARRATAGAGTDTAEADASEPSAAPASALRWIGLAFVPSSLMLGTTIYVVTDLASIPLLWIVPLALYLVSFIAVFARPRPRPSPIAVTAFVVLLLPLFVLSFSQAPLRPLLLLGHLGLMFVGGLVFHAELVRTRPPRAQLTRFYLAIAIGGALGGVFNALAPHLFTGITEYPLTMALACVLLPRPPAAPTVAGDRERALLRSVGLDPATVAGLAPTAREDADRQRARDRWIPLATTALALVAGGVLAGAAVGLRTLFVLALPVALCGLLSIRRPARLGLGLFGVVLAASLGAGEPAGLRHRERTFFGVLRVEDAPATAAHAGVRALVHGTIVHGQQSLDPALRRTPIAYYNREGPIGQVLDALRARPGAAAGAAIAVIGLGCGGLAAYAEPGDRWTFFEIDAAVERVARDARLFTYLADARAPFEVVLGDARVALTRRPPGGYALVIVDAFSSDAMPLHLMTREAIALYRARSAEDAIFAFNVSSRYVRLERVLGALARDAGMVGYLRRDARGAPPLRAPSAWIVLARRDEDLGALARDPRWRRLPSGGKAFTDDFSNLLGALDL